MPTPSSTASSIDEPPGMFCVKLLCESRRSETDISAQLWPEALCTSSSTSSIERSSASPFGFCRIFSASSISFRFPSVITKVGLLIFLETGRDAGLELGREAGLELEREPVEPVFGLEALGGLG